ncbi:uncharacterized protein LOC126906968 [Daktulosphaira vitifoliae]|uniref:uncharacterized protein LOC126906968 n=1 Tax=Daktulosphaira vitifoliae TaxID=58002 RepID=UPI0021AAEE71|nr:uncharacterized protein LOC126906968 [Daktulosphaira vitifoliae]
MFYKINSVVLIFLYVLFFRNVFVNTILIGKEGEIDICQPYDNMNRLDAEMIKEVCCLNTSNEYVMCKDLRMSLVNEKKIFAEIRLRYDDDSTTRKAKSTINLKITFGKKNIILNYKKEQKYYKYNEIGINDLQLFIRNLDENIYFNVVKIYESNVPIIRDLVNDTVYDNEIKDQLSNVQNLFLWKYAKDDFVTVVDSSCPNITLEYFIHNSTAYHKTVEQTLTTAIDIMYYRTAKYACLLVVYAYQSLNIFSGQNEIWKKIINVLRILSKAENSLKNYKEESLFLINISEKLKQINTKSSSRCKLLNDLSYLVSNFVAIILKPSGIDTKINENITHINMKTYILPEDISKKIFNGFPKPHENNVNSYMFENIPTALDDINKNLFTIFELIETEYGIFLIENE